MTSSIKVNPFQSAQLLPDQSHEWFWVTLLPTVMDDLGSKVRGQKILHILCSASVIILLHGITHLHYVKVDSDKGGRQSKMVANSKSHAVFQTAEPMVNYAIWEMSVWRG